MHCYEGNVRMYETTKYYSNVRYTDNYPGHYYVLKSLEITLYENKSINSRSLWFNASS